MFAALTDYGISSRAIQNELVSLEFWNPRNYATDKHRMVDDKPFGGGPGMLMKTEPLVASIQAAKEGVMQGPLAQAMQQAKVVYLSPQGKPLKQAHIAKLAKRPNMVLVCGRYQGIDTRVIDSEVDEEWSLGDFVVSGGELAAMALIDAMIRLQPGALGDEGSAVEDSFANGLLHSPEYTRPKEFEGRKVPSILLNGDHEAIRVWRLKQSLGSTWLKRPDLLGLLTLDGEQQELLEQFINEYESRNPIQL
jgi:tRNA (guanine37-N1)-methyltransferase